MDGLTNSGAENSPPPAPKKVGGARLGAGRKKGQLDRATIAQKGTLAEFARTHTQTAINALVKIAKNGESEAAIVSAATAILDRGYGRPAQAVELTGKDGGDLEIKVRNVAFERLLGLMTGNLIEAEPANRLPAE